MAIKKTPAAEEPQDRCPNCGYCPACGQAKPVSTPVYPGTNPYVYPPYYIPYRVWNGTSYIAPAANTAATSSSNNIVYYGGSAS